ncbi:hypothetical protein EJB05_35232, partial [Eragrostis curvula]
MDAIANGHDKHQLQEEAAGHRDRRQRRRHHFVLAHGLCHGAWCWYNAAAALRRAGHAVTAPDMAGCGAHPARLADVPGFEEYSRPLLDAVAALPEGERVVIVAHSHGGCGVALAAERFPDKVAAAVFVTASLPAVGRSMAAATTDEMDMRPVDLDRPSARSSSTYTHKAAKVGRRSIIVAGHTAIYGKLAND